MQKAIATLLCKFHFKKGLFLITETRIKCYKQQGNRRKRASSEAVFVIDIFIVAINIRFSEKCHKTILKKSVLESVFEYSYRR